MTTPTRRLLLVKLWRVLALQNYVENYNRKKNLLNRTQKEQARKCLLDILDAAEKFKDQERARQVRGLVRQRDHHKVSR
jgi:hypothetical protein